MTRTARIERHEELKAAWRHLTGAEEFSNMRTIPTMSAKVMFGRKRKGKAK